jgi:hypothetical protein
MSWYDHLAEAAADYTDEELTLQPDEVLPMRLGLNQAIHESEGGDEIVVELSPDVLCEVELQWRGLTETEAAPILDCYLDPAKARGRKRSFVWVHPGLGLRFTAKFVGSVDHLLHAAGSEEISSLRLKILGREPAA